MVQKSNSSSSPPPPFLALQRSVPNVPYGNFPCTLNARKINLAYTGTVLSKEGKINAIKYSLLFPSLFFCSYCNWSQIIHPSISPSSSLPIPLSSSVAILVAPSRNFLPSLLPPKGDAAQEHLSQTNATQGGKGTTNCAWMEFEVYINKKNFLLVLTFNF